MFVGHEIRNILRFIPCLEKKQDVYNESIDAVHFPMRPLSTVPVFQVAGWFGFCCYFFAGLFM
jgi:hypothetical protein